MLKINLKVKFRPSTIKGKEGCLYYQIIGKRIVKQILTNYKILQNEWCVEEESLIIQVNDDIRSNYLYAIQRKMQRDKNCIYCIINKYAGNGIPCTVDTIVKEFLKQSSETTLFHYMERLIVKFQLQGQQRTAETYTSTLNSFRKFHENLDVYFTEIDSELLLSYEYYLKSRDVSPNTISFYMKRLRAVYNRAVEDGLTEQCNPFKRVFTSTEKTLKRALPLMYIKKLKEMDLSYSTSKSFARDMFLFCFYTRGMSFIDIAYLQKKDLRDGTLTYRRKKTGQLLSIRWEWCMQEIVNRYASSFSSSYLFSIIKQPDINSRRQYHNALTLINRNLKEIGRVLGFALPLTMYVGRHSWASIARKEGISVSIISEGLGHDSESTTQIYLASLETEVIDEANKKILKLL